MKFIKQRWESKPGFGYSLTRTVTGMSELLLVPELGRDADTARRVFKRVRDVPGTGRDVSVQIILQLN